MSNKTSLTTLSCGCIQKTTIYNHTKKSPILISEITKLIKLCPKHKQQKEKQKEKQKKEETEFNTFPTPKSKQIYNLLDKMINKLGDDMVDVSFFPSQAYKTLKKFAIKIDKLTIKHNS